MSKTPKKKAKRTSQALSAQTRLAHAAIDPSRHFGFVNTPVYRGSTVLFETADKLFNYDQPYTYARNATPTRDALTGAFAEFDGAAGCVAVPSGLSAVTTALMALVRAGDHILVADSVYYPTRRFCNEVLAPLGVETAYYDPVIGGDISKLIRDNTRLVFTEAPGSQTMEMQDIPAIAKAAHARGAAVVMDNTWATPLYFKALEHGVDISVISASKFIGGHADIMMGLVSANEAHWPALERSFINLGLSVSGDEAALALRGLRTLPLRLERHQSSGLKVAQWLAGRPEVERVLYPVLADDPGHDIWRRDFTGATGVFSALLKPVSEQVLKDFLNALALFGMGYSWGGFESLVIAFNPAKYRSATKWSHNGPALRFHIGLEDPDDLITDLTRAFDTLV